MTGNLHVWILLFIYYVFSVIEVAIGEYGTDVQDELADTITKNNAYFIAGKHRHRCSHSAISGDQGPLPFENGLCVTRIIFYRIIMR